MPAALWRCRLICSRLMAPKRDQEVLEAFHEPPCSAGVPPASCGGVSPPARTPGGTPGELAGEDACATSAGQFMVPIRDSEIVDFPWLMRVLTPHSLPPG